MEYRHSLTWISHQKVIEFQWVDANKNPLITERVQQFLNLYDLETVVSGSNKRIFV